MSDHPNVNVMWEGHENDKNCEADIKGLEQRLADVLDGAWGAHAIPAVMMILGALVETVPKEDHERLQYMLDHRFRIIDRFLSGRQSSLFKPDEEDERIEEDVEQDAEENYIPFCAESVEKAKKLAQWVDNRLGDDTDTDVVIMALLDIIANSIKDMKPQYYGMCQAYISTWAGKLGAARMREDLSGSSPGASIADALRSIFGGNPNIRIVLGDDIPEFLAKNTPLPTTES